MAQRRQLIPPRRLATEEVDAEMHDLLHGNDDYDDISVDEIDQKIKAYNAANLAATGKRMDSTYTRNVQAFARFCHQEGLKSDEFGICTVKNVEFYLVGPKITESMNMHQTNRRVLLSLLYYARYVEKRGVDYELETPDVTAALKAAGSYVSSQMERGMSHEDAHDNLASSVISAHHETVLLRAAILDCSPVATFFLLAWTVMMACLCRGKELRNFRLPFLKYDLANGEDRSNSCDAPHSGCVLLIFERTTTKTRNKAKRVTGFWRHKDWYRCPVSMLGFSLAERLLFLTDEESSNLFKYPTGTDPKSPGKVKPNWYSLYLLPWRGGKEMGKVFTRLQQVAQIPKRMKNTHCRKDGTVK
jgi:hypothetical protein